jgi:hypothetical protein
MSDDRVRDDVVIQMLQNIEHTQRETREEIRSLGSDLKAVVAANATAARDAATQVALVADLMKKADDYERRLRFLERWIWGILAVAGVLSVAVQVAAEMFRK